VDEIVGGEDPDEEFATMERIQAFGIHAGEDGEIRHPGKRGVWASFFPSALFQPPGTSSAFNPVNGDDFVPRGFATHQSDRTAVGHSSTLSQEPHQSLVGRGSPQPEHE